MHHQEIIDKICKRHFVTQEIVSSNKKSGIIVAARYNLIHELYINGYGHNHISKILNLDRTTVYNGIDKHIENNHGCDRESSFQKHQSCRITQPKKKIDVNKKQMARRAYDRIIASSDRTIGSLSGAVYEKGGDKLLWWLVSQTPEGLTIMDTMASIALDVMYEEQGE